MDFDGFQWISMDFDGFRWISMDFDVFRWISMDSNGFRWISKDSEGFRRIPKDFDGFRRISKDFDGFRWISMGFEGVLRRPEQSNQPQPLPDGSSVGNGTHPKQAYLPRQLPRFRCVALVTPRRSARHRAHPHTPASH
jgi:hypothetical protein